MAYRLRGLGDVAIVGSDTVCGGFQVATPTGQCRAMDARETALRVVEAPGLWLGVERGDGWGSLSPLLAGAAVWAGALWLLLGGKR